MQDDVNSTKYFLRAVGFEKQNSTMSDNKERRQSARFKVKEGAYAISSSTKSNELLGQIIDISIGGLSFSYLDYENKYESIETSDIDLFISGTGFFFNNLLIKTISDIVPPDKHSFSSLPIRRRGIQFSDLSKQDKSNLNKFIRQYADDAV